MLGRLTSVLGDEAGARKVDAQSENRPPTDGERRWIERCVLALIRRAGKRAADPQKPLPSVTMADLPRLWPCRSKVRGRAYQSRRRRRTVRPVVVVAQTGRSCGAPP